MVVLSVILIAVYAAITGYVVIRTQSFASAKPVRDHTNEPLERLEAHDQVFKNIYPVLNVADISAWQRQSPSESKTIRQETFRTAVKRMTSEDLVHAHLKRMVPDFDDDAIYTTPRKPLMRKKEALH